jgi:hypothetical protein
VAYSFFPIQYYVIQLLCDDSSKSYYTWNRWGRVGLVGQNKVIVQKICFFLFLICLYNCIENILLIVASVWKQFGCGQT